MATLTVPRTRENTPDPHSLRTRGGLVHSCARGTRGDDNSVDYGAAYVEAALAANGRILVVNPAVSESPTENVPSLRMSTCVRTVHQRGIRPSPRRQRADVERFHVCRAANITLELDEILIMVHWFLPLFRCPVRLPDESLQG